ncbi:TPA: hypothetical protein N2G14_001300 [Salmonella enterica]|nr:hypothetical protein [Salmonella enterica]
MKPQLTHQKNSKTANAERKHIAETKKKRASLQSPYPANVKARLRYHNDSDTTQRERESRKSVNSHGVAFDFHLCESVFLRQKKTDEQWHIVADAHTLERSESLAISFLNLNQRAQDNPTVMRTTTAPIWLQSSLPDVSAHNVYYVKLTG